MEERSGPDGHEGNAQAAFEEGELYGARGGVGGVAGETEK